MGHDSWAPLGFGDNVAVVRADRTAVQAWRWTVSLLVLAILGVSLWSSYTSQRILDATV